MSPIDRILDRPLKAISRPFQSTASSMAEYTRVPADERKSSHDGDHLPSPESFDSVEEPLYRRPRPTRRKALYLACAIICFLALLLPSPLSRFRRLDQPISQMIKGKFGQSFETGDLRTAREYGILQRPYINESVVVNGSKALIIASFLEQDVKWLGRIPPSWDIKRYILDDPNPTNGLSVPANRGREAMAYLTYIIDNYDQLPDFMVFTHGHFRSWHQPEPLPMKIRALNLTALAYEDYISLTCGDQMGCETIPYMDTTPEHVNWPGQIGIRGFWDFIMPNQSLPRYLSHKCCAQFAVTRAAVQRLEQADWKRIREPILSSWDEMHAKYEWAKPHPWDPFPGGMVEVNDWTIGTWYEKFWHIWFGKGPHYCPSIEYCNRVQFQDAIRCDQYSDFSPFDGGRWRDSVCHSIYDHIDPTEEPDWSKWKILEEDAKIRSERWNKIKADREFIKKMRDEEQKHPAPPAKAPDKPLPAAHKAQEIAEKQDEIDKKGPQREDGDKEPNPDPPQDQNPDGSKEDVKDNIKDNAKDGADVNGIANKAEDRYDTEKAGEGHWP